MEGKDRVGQALERGRIRRREKKEGKGDVSMGRKIGCKRIY